MVRSLIGFALVFALGIFIGNSALAQVGNVEKVAGTCQGSQTCQSIKSDGHPSYGDCQGAACDFTTGITTGNYVGCSGVTPNGCSIPLPAVQQTCQGVCTGGSRPCGDYFYKCSK